MGTDDGSNWRQEWRPASLDDVDTDEPLARPQPVRIGRHGFRYTGPFGNNMSNHSFVHGNDSAWGAFEEVILRRSLEGLDMADAVMARIERPVDCHGTIAEIGYAHARGKPVYVMLVDPDDHVTGDIVVHAQGTVVDHPAWFPIAMARRVISVDRQGVWAGSVLLADLIMADMHRVRA